MYRIIARDLGIKFEPTDVPRFVEKQHFPDMFLGYIILTIADRQIMAMGINNLTHIIETYTFPQCFHQKNVQDKPLIFRKYMSLDYQGKYCFLSADVSRVWTPTLGRVVCSSHPKHGLTKKFAPIGKVYNERFCLLPIYKDYK